MLPTDRAEFLKELEATDEAYVRRKVLLGSYEGWQMKTAEYWLAQRHRQREEFRARFNHLWVAATFVATACGVLVTIYVAGIPK